ncbi:hypothetical protein BJX68DRAFT_234893, partial [Aspergillus pseudodeflectus]
MRSFPSAGVLTTETRLMWLAVGSVAVWVVEPRSSDRGGGRFRPEVVALPTSRVKSPQVPEGSSSSTDNKDRKCELQFVENVLHNLYLRSTPGLFNSEEINSMPNSNFISLVIGRPDSFSISFQLPKALFRCYSQTYSLEKSKMVN